MRHKTTSPSSSHPRKRQRRNPNPLLDQWAHAEWFQSTLDDPFFSHSEFTDVINTALFLPHLLSRPPTRLQLARLRAAMCNAFPGGFASPRRFSSAFLAAEVEELAMYRADARRLMRGADLLPATDPTTGDPLPQHWWSRYRCPPPLPPQRGADVFVRSCLPSRDFEQPQTNASPTFASPKTNTASSVRSNSSPTYIRRAVFVSLAGQSENCIRFTDDGTEHTVSDLDVMLSTISSFADVLNASPSTRALPNPDRLSPCSARFSFSSSPLPDIDISRIDAPSQLVQLYSSPRPVLVSPQRPVEIKSRTASHVECEVDVQQVAETMRLLDRKQELLVALRSLNDMVSARSTDGQKCDDSVSAQYKELLQQIDDVDTELQLLMHVERRANTNPALTTALSEPPIPQPKFDETPDEKRTQARRWHSFQQSPSLHCERGNAPAESAGAQQLPALRPEHLAKNVDFRNVTGAALLAKALTRASFAKLDPENKLKAAAPSTRADVMECVSACVAVLVRARATRDYHCIEELIDGIRVRFPENAEAIEAIHEAARSFDCTSSDSP